jgi:hypothetical protein
MSDQGRIKSKLQKLLALARQGVGGEKDNAQSVLNKLLAKHGLTIEDLDDAGEPRTTRWFKFKGEQEGVLLTHCVLATLGGTWDKSSWRRGRGERGYDLTNAEFAQVDLLFSIHRRALAEVIAKQLKSVMLAYLSTNHLYSQDDDSDGAADVLPPEDLQAILGVMAGLRPTPVHRAITGEVR